MWYQSWVNNYRGRAKSERSDVSLIMRGVMRSVEAKTYEGPRSPSALDVIGVATTVAEVGVIAIPVMPAGAEKIGVETIDAGKVKTGTGPVGVALGEASKPVRLNKNERLGLLLDDLANRDGQGDSRSWCSTSWESGCPESDLCKWKQERRQRSWKRGDGAERRLIGGSSGRNGGTIDTAGAISGLIS